MSMLCVFIVLLLSYTFFFFFFNDTATTEIYTLSLHDALPISLLLFCHEGPWHKVDRIWTIRTDGSGLRKIHTRDRKSTRLNSSHLVISYAVFCLKKKKKRTIHLSHHSQAPNVRHFRSPPSPQP